MVFTFVKFLRDPEPFKYFRYSFITKKLALEHYVIKIMVLVLTLLLVSLLPEHYYIHPIPPALMLVYTLAYRPYKFLGENLRASFNWLVISILASTNIVVHFLPISSASCLPVFVFLVIVFFVLLPIVVVVGLVSNAYL